MAEQIVQIKLENITTNPDNRRVGGFDQAKLEQLAESIRAVGVQQPAVVRKIPLPTAGDWPHAEQLYELVAGERRWRAAKLAGLETLPCVVRELDDITVLKIHTIENLQREDVHPLDEADGFARLIERAGYDVDTLARELGKSASFVYQRLKLRDLVPVARELFEAGKISAGHAILIARLQPPQQEQVVELISEDIDDDESAEWLTVRNLNDVIQSDIMMDLATAAFKRDDAELVPSAGACTDCAKRTGSQPMLFADIGPKHDYCTDRSCFTEKLDALVARRRAELKGEKVLEVADGYQSKHAKNVLQNYEWTECKKKDKDAQPVLVVEGPGRGRITWGKKNTGGFQRYEVPPEEKQRREREKTKQRIETAIRQRLWNEVTSRLSSIPEDLGLPILRMIVQAHWGRAWAEVHKVIVKLEGWERPKQKGNYNSDNAKIGKQAIEKMNAPELLVFLFKVGFAPELHVGEYGDSGCAGLKAAVELFGLSYEEISNQVKKELQEKPKRGGKKAEPESDEQEAAGGEDGEIEPDIGGEEDA